MNGAFNGSNIVQYGTAAERAALDTSLIKPLSEWYETDTGAYWKWFDTWVAWSPSYGRPGGISTGTQIKQSYTALLVGDSISAIAETIIGATGVVNNGDGTGTITRGSTWGASIGEPIRISAAPTQALNVMDSTIVAIGNSGRDLTFSLGGRTHTVTSPSAPSAVFPNRRTSRGYLNWIESKLGRQFRTTWCATSGATASQINALLNATLITFPHDVGFLLAGMNNIYSALQDFDTAWAEIKTLIDNTRNKCNFLNILTIPPRNSADSQWTAARQAIHTKLNRAIYDYGLSVGANVIDTWGCVQNGTTYVNAAATNPDPNANFVIDNTHPSTPGGAAIGQAIALLNQSRNGSNGWLPAHLEALGADSGNIITDGGFVTNTGGVATGWTQSSTTAGMTVTPTCVARTVAADGDAAGFNQVFTIAIGTAGASANFRFQKSGIQALFAPYVGKKVQFTMQYSMTGATGVTGIEIAMSGTVPSGFWQVLGMAVDGNTDILTGSLSGTLITSAAVVPASLSALDIWVRPYINSSQTGNVVFTFWKPEIYEVK